MSAYLNSLNYTVTDYLDFSSNHTKQNQSISRLQSVQISKRPGLVENLPLLNSLFVGILCAMATNSILFYFQMWWPMVKEEEVEQSESTKEMVEVMEVMEMVEDGAFQLLEYQMVRVGE